MTPQVTKQCKNIPKTETTSGVNCTYSLPGNVTIRALNEQIPDDYTSGTAFSPDYRRTTNMSVVALPRYQTLWSNDPRVVTSFSDPDLTTPDPKKTTFQGVVDPILGFGRVLFNSSTDPTVIIGSDVMPTATECALYWCVQTLNTSIQNGILNQTILKTWSNDSALDTSDVYLSPYIPRSTSNHRPDYYVSPMSNVPLARFLQDAFNASVKGINLPNSQFTPDELLDLTIYSSDIAQALWHTNDLKNLMNNLADRMTDALRNLYSIPAAESDASSLGDVYTTQTYVHVTWPWLILPVGLVLASCAVLLAAVIESSRYRAVVWKSSSLAVMFHGIDGRVSENGSGGNVHSMYRKEMEMAAEEMKVRLAERRDGAIRLMEVKTGGSEVRDERKRWMGWLGRGKRWS